jgi:hypothetical protein
MNCFIQVVPFVLLELISDFDFYVWIIHLKADIILCIPKICENDLEMLEKYILLWREGM